MVITFDLDDTLYDEIDFVHSGFRAVSDFLEGPSDEILRVMLDIFGAEGSGKVFNRTLEHFGLAADIPLLVSIYRYHVPTLDLPAPSRRLLERARQDHATALVTDGPYLMQKNKFDVLGIAPYIRFSVFSDRHGTRKPEHKPFSLVMEHFAGEEEFVYVADNPAKDFLAPAALGWRTIRYRNPRGIYRETPSDADHETDSLDDVMALLG